MAGRLKRLAYKPFDKQRYRGLTVPAYIIEAELESSVIRKKTTGESKPYINLEEKAKTVNVNNGFYSPLAPRYQTFIDYSDDWVYDHDVIQSGEVSILSKTVPNGLAWYVDNMYFFASAIGGPMGFMLLDSIALAPYITLQVFTSSSQLTYTSFERIGPQLPITSFPFLNDRIGSREAKFGITLYEGESIRAVINPRQAAVPIPAVVTIGFRFMGIQAAKNDIEDYLEAKRWPT
jgi:hypothetical protein